jgi:TfoX/Sxy family transcriptional regulator of competence genes
MSTSPETVAYFEDQLSELNVRSARMFGEACLYVDGKVIGFICDDTLFIKPSAVDESFLIGTVPGHPYPGSKLYHSVPGDLAENRDWLIAAVQATADALPLPAPKRSKSQP